MTEDLLKAATRALREETEEATSDARLARARLMAGLHQGTLRRRTRLAFVLPIAACFAVGTAWGAATGRLPAVLDSIAEAIGLASPAPGLVSPPPTAPGPTAIPEAVTPPPPALGSAAAVEKSAPTAPVASAPFRDNDGDLYRLAHEAHFARHDYVAALSGWEGYLAAAPGGRLASEARYNRALCLLRLGRDAEAKQALEPFAAGAAGGYRRGEAQRLLDELSRQDVVTAPRPK